jgi:hypothetical protein
MLSIVALTGSKVCRVSTIIQRHSEAANELECLVRSSENA